MEEISAFDPEEIYNHIIPLPDSDHSRYTAIGGEWHLCYMLSGNHGKIIEYCISARFVVEGLAPLG
jgi:hypothetical protein